MAKRTASSDINRDNWDDPLEAEDKGTFKTASQDVLQKRVLKTAKRRIKPSENNEVAKSVFASFSGFKPADPISNTNTASKPFGFLGAVTSSSPAMKTNSTNGTSHVPDGSMSNDITPQQKYLFNLQQLNRSVSDWIKIHVDQNPICILTPVFNDYERHLKQIQEERDSDEKGNTKLTTTSNAPSLSFVSSSTNTNEGSKYKLTFLSPQPNDNIKTFKFADTSVKADENKQSPTMFALPKDTGKSPLSEDKDNKPSIFSSFKSDSAVSSVLTKPDPASLMVNPFLTKTDAKPPSFSNGSPSATPTSTNTDKEKKNGEEEEESDQPPKVEFTPIQEEGSVFSSRCKVFVKKDSNYKDKGVGTLFIKKVGEEKYQLLVRAETVLGNILLNVLLSSSLPTQRMGKNNVMLVCLPTPQDPPPPTTVLLRVKTGQEADDLLATLEQYKH